jgi:hypothetical protein
MRFPNRTGLRVAIATAATGALAAGALAGVTPPVPATGWYLNLHQGTSSNILANGQPTPNFRPLLCASL